MNYTGCFNRSRDGLQQFAARFCFRSWCLDAARLGVLQPVPFCALLVSQCCQVWSVAAFALCAPPGASMLPGVECCPLHRCAVPGAPQWCYFVTLYIL